MTRSKTVGYSTDDIDALMHRTNAVGRVIAIVGGSSWELVTYAAALRVWPGPGVFLIAASARVSPEAKHGHNDSKH